MTKPRFFLICFFGYMILGGNAQAFSDAPLLFRDSPNGPRERAVIAALSKSGNLQPGIGFKIAATDLNGDGVSEWIVSSGQQGCERRAACRIHVMGLRLGRPALLGAMNSGKIALSPEKAYGVRRLMLYNNPSNDFTHQLYSWSPPAEAFVPD